MRKGNIISNYFLVIRLKGLQQGACDPDGLLRYCKGEVMAWILIFFISSEDTRSEDSLVVGHEMLLHAT